MTEYVIGLDLGTTGIKAVLFNGKGEMVRTASREAGPTYPRPGWVLQNPAAWYETACEVIHEAAADLDRSAVKAIGISSQGISFVPVDEENLPLCDGISWLDMRAEGELRRLGETVGAERFFRETGKPMNPAYTLPKLIWLREHEKEIFGKASKFLMPMDYFLARAVGICGTDPTMAGGTMLLDIRTGKWSEALCRETGIPMEKLPEVLPAGTKLGRLLPDAAARTGLENAVVVMGAQDQKAAAYGARLRDGTATLSLGTAGAIEVLAREPSRCLPSFRYIDGERICLEGCVDTAGAAIRWVRNTLFPGESYEALDALAETAASGCGGVLFRPRLGRTEEKAGWTGLTLGTGRAEIVRSVFEGLGCEVRLLLEAAKAAGASVEEIHAFGGGAQGDILCRILAQICRVPVLRMRMGETAALGAARMAWEAVGGDGDTFGGGQDAERFSPEDTETGDQIYEAYRKTM